MSVLGDLLTASAAMVEDLAITLNSTVVPVLIRKLPEISESIEEVPAIFVCASQRQGFQLPFHTAGTDDIPTMKVENRIQIALAFPGNRDNLTHVDDYPGWMEQIGAAFGNQDIFDRSDVLMIRVVSEVYLDRAAYSKLYDYLAMEIRITTVNSAY